MLFSLEWLLQLCPLDADVARIVDALTSRGLTVDAAEPVGTDHVLDVDVPANRPDCLGHLGLARELAASFDADLAPAPALPATDGAPAEGEVDVEIEDGSLCPRYTAGIVRSVTVGPSPAWVVRRLETCGLRSVSNVVDASNLVMLELGQPIHFFDLDRLSPAAEGGRPVVRVRAARPGERLVTLDGVERHLRPETLVIADGARAVALAGVIGGADTEIGPTTRDVLVEAARFDARSVRRTARRLAVQTDASFRFERGGDFAAPPAAQALAARHLHDLAGGVPAAGPIDAAPGSAPPRTMVLRIPEVRRLLGFRPEAPLVQDALEALRLSPAPQGTDAIEITVPTWRQDLEREADLVEEVARHIGYDKIPTGTSGLPAQIERELEAPRPVDERCRDVISHLGFHEAYGYAMIAAGEDDRFVETRPESIPLTNPIAEPLSRMRRSVLPGLLRAADLNLRRGTRDVRLFEVGRVFFARDGGEFPREPSRAGLVLAGAADRPHWSREAREIDLYEVMGVVEHVLEVLHSGADRKRVPGGPDAFHPARSVRWIDESSGRDVAWAGALHPDLQRNFGQTVLVAEIALDRLAAVPGGPRQHRPVARFPAVTRDLALVLSGGITYARVIEVLRSVEPPAPVRFDAVDRYEGPPLAARESSLTLRFTLQPRERTLTDSETETFRTSLVGKLEHILGVRIRV